MSVASLRNQPFFYFLIAFVAFLSYLVLKPFLSAIVLAFLAALFFKPVYTFFQRIFKKKDKLAAMMSVVIVFFVVLIPLVSVGGLTVNQIIQFKNDFGSEGNIDLGYIVEKVNNVIEVVPVVEGKLTVDGVQDWIQNAAKSVGSFFLERLPDIGSGAFHSLTWVLIFIILVYSLFPIQDKFMHFLEHLSPLDDRIDRIYLTRVVEMSKSMVKGTFAIAIVQGIVSGVFLAIAGVDYVLFLTVLMIFLGVIPMVGSGFVMIPIGVIMLFTGNIWQGVMLLLVTMLLVNNIDNYLRPKLVSKKAELHPALVILGVLGGLQVFGVLGFIYGPVIMILLVTTVEMYMKYAQKHPEKDASI